MKTEANLCSFTHIPRH